MLRQKCHANKIVTVILMATLAISACSRPSKISQKDTAELKQRLDAKIRTLVDNRKKFGLSFCISSGDGSFTWCGASGVLDTNSSYPVASITKMFTGALILHLRSQGLIDIDEKITRYLDNSATDSIHRYRNRDYSGQLTVRQLLSHTSGLPDYFTEKNAAGESFETIRKQRDMVYSFDDVIQQTKLLNAHFAPGTKGKAYYSDANYQLLGKIIESVTKMKLADAYNFYIFKPLQLTHSYLETNDDPLSPVAFYHGGIAQRRPGFVSSEFSTGGIVSTSEDMMVFLRAYFGGKLFPSEYFSEMKHWNAIQFFPVNYGMNLMRIKMPGMPCGELIGHSGSTGTVAYYVPEMDLYITGATLQLDTFTSIMVTARLLACLK